MILLDTEAKPVKQWGGQNLSEVLSKWTTDKIDHSDYSNSVCAHPKIPVYISGN